MIEVRGLTKSFGGVVALRGIDLDIAAGQFLTIFGPNGAGKTTFIRILAMLSQATAGYVRIEGLNLAEGDIDIRRRIGLIPHNSLLYGDLTPEENLRFYGKMYDVPDLEERIETVLGQVGLVHRCHDPVRTFSRGMQQRLSIARAILHNPSIMLLDEPYTGLDQQAAQILEEILETVGAGSRTVVMTTHNLERGLAMCDRVAILVDGQIVYQADRSDLDVSSLRKIYHQHVSAMKFHSIRTL